MSEAKMKHEKHEKRKDGIGFHLIEGKCPENECGMRSGKMHDGKKDGKKSMKDGY